MLKELNMHYLVKIIQESSNLLKGLVSSRRCVFRLESCIQAQLWKNVASGCFGSLKLTDFLYLNEILCPIEGVVVLRIARVSLLSLTKFGEKKILSTFVWLRN